MQKLSYSNSSPYIFQILPKVIPESDISFTQSKSLIFLDSNNSSLNDANSILKKISSIFHKNRGISIDSNAINIWIDSIHTTDRSYHLPLTFLFPKIDENIQKHKFLSSDSLSFSDLIVLSYLEKNRQFTKTKIPDSIQTWLKSCIADDLIKNLDFSNVRAMSRDTVCQLEQGGRFFELPDATEGEVVVRFPPEASGYLHIGHAKAALLNQIYKERYKGKLVLRFDDTNPSKEKESFEKIILEDVKSLGLTPDIFTKTSDHFDLIMSLAEGLIKKGLAYCDNTPVEEMRTLRTNKTASAYRDSSVDDNLKRWELLKSGVETEWCLRAKIDYNSVNGCLRDPTIYRYCLDPHPTCGDKYKVYPTYDFACPIVDSSEGVTHSLRTLEYHDRDEQYKWFINALELREPHIIEFSKITLQHTVLSKRKLTKIVDSKIVDGWDDPRMPTIRGLIRRGLTSEALKQFVIAQGFSKSVVNMKSDKLWAFNKRLIDPTSYRLIGLNTPTRKATIISDIPHDVKEVPLIPKSNNLTRAIKFSKNILIEEVEGSGLQVGDVVTLINWGNAIVESITSSEIALKLDLNNMDFSKTKKVAWLNDTVDSNEHAVNLTILSYKNLLTKGIISADDDFEALINHDSKSSTRALGEPYFKTLKDGDIIQILKKGYYRVDKAYKGGDDFGIVLIEIPAGDEDENKPPKISADKKVKSTPRSDKKSENIKAVKSQPQPPQQLDGKKTKLGLSISKTRDFSHWYTELITKSEMLDYYSVSGCYVIRPWAFSIWECIQSFVDAEIKKLGAQNCYFPMFVSESALIKEKDHISDFAPEVAWVTRAGSTNLAEPIAIRPTSETVMYPIFANWIKSYRDLPMKLNQWSNVVRWEFKHPTPFLRTREFLWQEGHTVYDNQHDAIQEVHDICSLYERVYVELLAIPVVKGTKSEAEKFAGAEFTTTVEAYISACGRGLQGATSHHLGQNFSKMFDIGYEDPVSNEKKFVYQNSWGLSTRTIGALVMVHGDDKGLVLPPRVAPLQVVIIPCGISAQSTEADKRKIISHCGKILSNLRSCGVRVKLDDRDHLTPGWKYNDWELKGVPIRIDIGPKDILTSTVMMVRRDTGQKTPISVDVIGKHIHEALENIQKSMYSKALADMNNNITICENWSDFTRDLNSKKIIYSPFCGSKSCEEVIRKISAVVATESDETNGTSNVVSMGAKTLCIPAVQPKELAPATKCINKECKADAKFYSLFGRSY